MKYRANGWTVNWTMVGGMGDTPDKSVDSKPFCQGQSAGPTMKNDKGKSLEPRVKRKEPTVMGNLPPNIHVSP